MSTKRKHSPRLLRCLSLLLLLAVLLPANAVYAAQITTKKTEALKKQYASAPENGIAAAGSSSISSWDMNWSFEETGYSPSMLYNYGINATTAQEWNNAYYIAAVADKSPLVTILYGANGLQEELSDADYNKPAASWTCYETLYFMETLRDVLISNGVPSPYMIFVSAVKTPSMYKASQSETTSCPFWDRIDLLNAQMKQYADEHSWCEYFDIESYLYHKDTRTGELLYYTGTGTEDATAAELISKKKKSAFFKTDLKHQSETAYRQIWSGIAKKAVSTAAKKAKQLQELRQKQAQEELLRQEKLRQKEAQRQAITKTVKAQTAKQLNLKKIAAALKQQQTLILDKKRQQQKLLEEKKRLKKSRLQQKKNQLRQKRLRKLTIQRQKRLRRLALLKKKRLSR